MYRIFVLYILLGAPSAVESNCSTPGSPQCVSAIKSRFNQDNAFWWGSWYNTNCVSGNKLYCIKPTQLAAGKTLKSAIPGIDENKITQYLTITYTSSPGSYEGCDTTVTRTEAETFSLDPLSTDTYPSWDARVRPTVNWEAKPATAMYTLLVLDVSVGTVNGLWANIQGSPGGGFNLDNADKVFPYKGPTNPYYERSHPLVFMLFQQGGEDRINISPNNYGADFSLQSSMSSFISSYQLIGPKAVNWLLVEGDIYGTNQMITNNKVYNCPSYVKRASLTAPHMTRAFLQTSSDRDVFVQVTISAPSIVYTLCCDTKSQPSTTTVLDPIGNPTLNAAETRSVGSTQQINFEKAGLLIGSNTPSFTGERYTLLAVDPDVPNPAAGTPELPIMHMLVTNIEDGDFNTGDVLQAYAGPMNPEATPHYYYFLLYKQQGGLEFTFNFTDVQTDYMDTTACPRCLFDISSFVTQKQLELVGATWMKVPNDDYVNYLWVQSGTNESNFCSEVSGWTPGQTCTSGTGIISIQINAEILSLLVLVFVLLI